jgi:hypothetical protein
MIPLVAVLPASGGAAVLGWLVAWAAVGLSGGYAASRLRR